MEIKKFDVDLKVTADPVSAVSNAVSDVSKMITKALPSDEVQLERLKLRSPWIYGWVRKRIFKALRRELIKSPERSIDVWVDYKHAAYADSTRAELKTLLHDDLKR